VTEAGTEGAATLHVELSGRNVGRGGKTFVLLHGFGASSFSWRHWLPALQRRGRVAAVDLKGFGASQKPDDGRYAPGDQIELLMRWIDEEDPASLTLVGHSYGGGLALFTAVELCERGDRRLDRLVVVAGAAYRQSLPPFVALSRRPLLASAGVRLLGAERVIRLTMRGIVFEPSSIEEESVRAYAAALKTRSGLSAVMEAARAIVPEDLDERVRRYPVVDVPTLLLWGDSDPVVPLRIGRRLAEDLPDARLEILARCGHVPHEERPEASLVALERFLDDG
jgi:pimeloyl-ACP methyl ester carboxylesterase